MKVFFLFVVTVVYFADIDGRKPFANLWRKPANKTNQILKRFYCRGRNFTDVAKNHTNRWVESVKRLWFVFWLGVCPDCAKTTTRRTTTTPPPPPPRYTGPPRGKPLPIPWMPLPEYWDEKVDYKAYAKKHYKLDLNDSTINKLKKHFRQKWTPRTWKTTTKRTRCPA